MRPLMVQGTSSAAGKTVLVAALCRIFSNMGLAVAPFKSQNMSNLSYNGDGFEISRAQAVQAVAARCKITPDLNPILLKPLGNYASDVFLRGKRFKRMQARDYYGKFAVKRGLDLTLESFSRLQAGHDLVILEGAGSPAEINMQRYDIANMKIAKKTGAAVLIVSDIERGGSFASIVGTLELLDQKYRDLVEGFVINKFRGDIKILEPGLKKLARITKKPVLGTIPMLDVTLPEEDSLGADAEPFAWNDAGVRLLERRISKLAALVEKNLNIGKIVRLTKC